MWRFSTSSEAWPVCRPPLHSRGQRPESISTSISDIGYRFVANDSFQWFVLAATLAISDYVLNVQGVHCSLSRHTSFFRNFAANWVESNRFSGRRVLDDPTWYASLERRVSLNAIMGYSATANSWDNQRVPKNQTESKLWDFFLRDAFRYFDTNTESIWKHQTSFNYDYGPMAISQKAVRKGHANWKKCSQRNPFCEKSMEMGGDLAWTAHWIPELTAWQGGGNLWKSPWWQNWQGLLVGGSLAGSDNMWQQAKVGCEQYHGDLMNFVSGYLQRPDSLNLKRKILRDGEQTNIATYKTMWLCDYEQ